MTAWLSCRHLDTLVLQKAGQRGAQLAPALPGEAGVQRGHFLDDVFDLRLRGGVLHDGLHVLQVREGDLRTGVHAVYMKRIPAADTVDSTTLRGGIHKVGHKHTCSRLTEERRRRNRPAGYPWDAGSRAAGT